MQDKHLILIGDLGVGINLIKNIFFLDNRYTPPFDYDIINTLYDSKNFQNWIRKEYKTRQWRENDISDIVPKNLSLSAETCTIYINHSAFHTPSDLDIILQQPAQVIVLLPKLDLSFDWQIRAYIEKVGNVHDFGGETPEMNLVNMYEIMYKRKNEMNELCVKKEIPILHTDSLYQGNFKKFFTDSSSYVNIDYKKAGKIYNKWLQCHWDYSKTRQWYFYANRSNI